MPYVRAEEMTYTQVRALDMSRAVCFLPVSALEVHGPHLPLGMDVYMARWMAEETGRRFAEAHPEWTVVQLPALTLGTDELPLAGSMSASQPTVYRALLSHGRSLATAGYRYIVLTNGHGGPRHASAIEYACRRVSKRHGVQMFSPAILVLHRIFTLARLGEFEAVLGRPLTDSEKSGMLNGEHAGTWETSFMLAQNPTLVEPVWNELALDGPPAFEPLRKLGERMVAWRERRGRDTAKLKQMFETLSGGIGWMLNTKYGYGGPTVTYEGDPSVASADVGHAARHLMAHDCLEIVEAVTSGRMRAADVRSIASDHFLIQPGALAKLGLAAALIVVLLVL